MNRKPNIMPMTIRWLSAFRTSAHLDQPTIPTIGTAVKWALFQVHLQTAFFQDLHALPKPGGQVHCPIGRGVAPHGTGTAGWQLNERVERGH